MANVHAFVIRVLIERAHNKPIMNDWIEEKETQ